MTRWRGRWLVAVLIAVLAVFSCAVGLASETEGETEKELILFSSSDSITLYIDEGNEAISASASIAIYARLNDYKTPIDNVQFSYTPKDSDKDILEGVSFDDAHSSTSNVDWYSYLHYSPITTGTCVYTVTASASVDGKNYEASKDITFTVTDDTSDLPTSIELDSEYFDESGVYKKELAINESTGTAVISDAYNTIFPTYIIDGITKKCGFSYSGNNFELSKDDLVFKKSGKHALRFFVHPSGSNWALGADVTFIVKPAVEPQNPVTIVGIPEEDMLISATFKEFIVTVENPEQSVVWDVACSNDNINMLKSLSNDGNTLTLTVWSYTKGITGTITVKAYYDGYDNSATVETFNVYTEKVTLEADIPSDTITLYMSDDDVDSELMIYNSASLDVEVWRSDYENIDELSYALTCSEPDNAVLSNIEARSETFGGETYWYLTFKYAPIKAGSCTYTFTASIPGTDYQVSKEIKFIVNDDISSLNISTVTNPEYFDSDGMFIKSELTMPADGSPLILSLPDEALPTFTINEITYRSNGYNFGGAEYNHSEKSITFSKAGKYDVAFYSDVEGCNWSIKTTATFIVNSVNDPENATPTISGIPTESMLIDNDTWITLTSENSVQLTKWTVSCDNDLFDVVGYPIVDNSTDKINIGIFCDSPNESAIITVKAYYHGYEDDAAIATFNVHTTPEEKPALVIDLGRDSIYTLYSGENDGALTIKTSGSFYLGSIEFSDKSSIHEFEPVITLAPNDEDGAFDCSVYSYEGYVGGEGGQQIRIVKLKYESLPAIGTHEYTLHAEIPGTDYTAEAPVTINVIDTTVLPREIVLLPETEALFTNDVYNQTLYLDSNGKASVSLDLARDESNESPNLNTVCDKFIYCHDECTKGITEDRKYVFTFDGAGQHYVVLHLASDYSNWYVERPLTFNVLDPEPVITSGPYYPPFNPTEEPIPEPTAAPTLEPTAEPTIAPTPTPTPIKEVTTGGRSLNVRLSPVNGDVVAKLPNGTRLEVLGSENGWSRVRATLPDGTIVEGYVMEAYLSDTEPTHAPATSTPNATLQPGATPTAAPTAGTPTATPAAPAQNVAKVVTSGSSLRLRSNPSTRSDVLVRMPNNAEVTILETVDGWMRIRFTARNGREYEGWASADFIKPAERPTTPPAPTAVPEPTTPPQPTATPKPNSPARVDAGGKRLNMRTRPGAGSDVVIKLPADAELIVIEYGEKWSLCSYGGVIGYCSNDFLRFK